MNQLTPEVKNLMELALSEDLSIGDPTTEALIPPDLTGSARLVAKEEGILAGIEIALAVFTQVDHKLKTSPQIADGCQLESGTTIASVTGSLASILMAERTSLNLLQRLSGIATESRKYMLAVKDFKTHIVDTRKTTPGLRTLEKYAVRTGGCYNHRRSLGDGILIKDNHIHALRKQGLDLVNIVTKARANASHTLQIEVEVENLDQVQEALDARADILLLDNMQLEEMRKAVKLAKGNAITEASGGINLRTVRQIASTGVDLISVGALTHSVKALDISLDLE